WQLIAFAVFGQPAYNVTDLIYTRPRPARRQFRQVGGVGGGGFLVFLFPAVGSGDFALSLVFGHLLGFPVFAAGLAEAVEQLLAGFGVCGFLFAPVGGELAGDGGLEQGLAVALQQREGVFERGFALIQLGEQFVYFFNNLMLLVKWWKQHT